MKAIKDISSRAKNLVTNENGAFFICGSEPIDWKPYQEYEKRNRKCVEPNNEGREITITLPNKWGKLFSSSEYAEMMKEVVHEMVILALGKKTDMQWAVRWSEDRAELLLKVVFSERIKTETEARYWDRNVYIANDGLVARRQADRAKDIYGNEKPPKYLRGELKLGGFTQKNKNYQTKAFLQGLLKQLKEEFKNKDTVVNQNKLLQEHRNPNKSKRIAHTNSLIRKTNDEYKKFILSFPTKIKLADDVKQLLEKNALDAIDKGEVYSFI